MGQGCVQEVDDLEGVDQLALGIAWVDAATCGVDLGRGGIEVLILQLALLAAVDGEGEVRPEGGDIEVVHTLADLLVGGEGDAQRPVL